MAGLDDNIPARKTPLSPEELPLVKGLQLLTMKPVRAHHNVGFAAVPIASSLQACGLPSHGEWHVGAVHALALPLLLTIMLFRKRVIVFHTATHHVSAPRSLST